MPLIHKKRGESLWKCDCCGKVFGIKTHRVPGAIRHFCGRPCQIEHARVVDSRRVTDWVKKNGSPNRKAGTGLTTDGYVWVYMKGYWNNQVKLHRYIMEVKLGRKLKSSEIVHHMNHDKLDNRIENLAIMTRSEHNREHGFLKGGRK
jgi:hypothetical protein